MPESPGAPADTAQASPPTRRSLFAWLGRAAMVAGLVSAYGTFAAFLARFLYPVDEGVGRWTFVTAAAALMPGAALSFRTPAGATVAVARQGPAPEPEPGGAAPSAEEFVALSSVCPHLGCQVHWEAHNDRFFCPCHNGVFDPSGKAVSGPPADAGQDLGRYPLKIDRGLLYIALPPAELAAGGRLVPDPRPCAAARRRA